MGRIFARGSMLHLEYVDASGKQKRKSSGLAVGHESEAEELLREMEALVKQRASGNAASRKTGETLRSFATQWIKAREGRVRSAADEEARLRLHVLPTMGDMLLVDIKPRHIRDLILDLRAADKLAPRTIRHVYGVLSNLLKHAVFEEVIDHSPCTLPKGVLPAKVDKDPEWRATALFTREEIVALISDAQIPADRHLVYGLKALAGLRHGELAGLRWSNYKPGEKPLGMIVVARSYDNERTKTGVTRKVPVHPVLASLLAEWKLSGWQTLSGRKPEDGDLIVPTRTLKMPDKKDAHEALGLDLKKLGFRPRRGHDFRRSFVTIAQVDGARRDILKDISHGPSGDIVSMYTSFPWPTLCAEIAKMDFKLPCRERAIRAVAGDPKRTPKRTVTKKASQPLRLTGLPLVTPPGLQRYPNQEFQVSTSARPRKSTRRHSSASSVETLRRATLTGESQSSLWSTRYCVEDDFHERAVLKSNHCRACLYLGVGEDAREQHVVG